MTTTANNTGIIFNDSSYQTTAASSALSSGTKMPFIQSAAPTGWTKLTTDDNKQIRVVTGNANTGGTTTFSSVYVSATSSNVTLSSTTMPAHTHGSTLQILWAGSPRYFGGNSWGKDTALTSGNNDPAGGTTPHNHSYALNVKYVDVILASKN